MAGSRIGMPVGEMVRQYGVEAPIINAATIANGVPVTSSAVPCAGYNQATLYISTTRVQHTRIDVTVETSFDGSTWHTVMEEDAAVPPTVTLAVREYQFTTSASVNFEITFPLNAPNFRIKLEGVSGTTDTCTVKAYLGAV